MQAMRALKDIQENLCTETSEYVPDGPPSVITVDDGEKSGTSGISNPLIKKMGSAERPRAREGMGGFKNQKQEDFVNKLLAKTPFYANKHNNHLCKGLNWQAQHSTMKEARKRFEQELLLNKQKDLEDEKFLRELEVENERFQSAQEMRKENTKKQFTDILREQMIMDKMKKTIEKQEDQIG